MTRPPTHDHELDSNPDERFLLIADYLREIIALLVEIRDGGKNKPPK
jgi:hypothetical protein